MRQTGFKHINMDLIVGLPEEGRTEFEESLREVLRLGRKASPFITFPASVAPYGNAGCDCKSGPAGQAIGNTGEIMAAAGYLPTIFTVRST